ncbi:MAG: hypothetical protein QOE93_371, partial [Actinomycetota bacterium]|nr:hypothetical protein [Actinomycetota bacterium]
MGRPKVRFLNAFFTKAFRKGLLTDPFTPRKCSRLGAPLPSLSAERADHGWAFQRSDSMSGSKARLAAIDAV